MRFLRWLLSLWRRRHAAPPDLRAELAETPVDDLFAMLTEKQRAEIMVRFAQQHYRARVVGAGNPIRMYAAIVAAIESKRE